MALPALLAGGRIAAAGIGRAASAALSRVAMVRRVSVSVSNFQWLGRQTQQKIELDLDKRLNLAALFLRDRVVVNISRPVTKLKRRSTGRTYTDSASRSKPGEFPKADTTRLMKDIFWEKRAPLQYIVGTTLDYGLILETSTRLNRSFLRRTLREQQPAINAILARRKKV